MTALEQTQLENMAKKIESIIRARAGWNKKGTAPRIRYISIPRKLDKIELDPLTAPTMIRQSDKRNVVYVGVQHIHNLLTDLEREILK